LVTASNSGRSSAPGLTSSKAGGHLTPTPTLLTAGSRLSRNESKSYVTTDGQSASLSWPKAPIWDLRPDFYYSQTVERLLMWDAISDEKMGLSFAVVAGPRQRIHSWVPVPWDSSPYYTVSDSRLPFSSPPTTRRATVEVFEPASTRDCPVLKVKVTLRLTVSQSVSLGVEPHLGFMTRYFTL
jgi:hypothetical protein